LICLLLLAGEYLWLRPKPVTIYDPFVHRTIDNLRNGIGPGDPAWNDVAALVNTPEDVRGFPYLSVHAWLEWSVLHIAVSTGGGYSGETTTARIPLRTVTAIRVIGNYRPRFWTNCDAAVEIDTNSKEDGMTLVDDMFSDKYNPRPQPAVAVTSFSFPVKDELTAQRVVEALKKLCEDA